MLLTIRVGDALQDALQTTLPLAAFLICAMWLVRRAERAGLAERLAQSLLTRSRGNAWLLFLLVCGLTAALTAVVSLDGAVILMLPLVLSLARGQPQLLRPLLLGSIAVANTFSLALPEGNPTNLVVMARLGISPARFVEHLFVPGLVATAICVTVVAVTQRAALRTVVQVVQSPQPAARTQTPLPVPWLVLVQIAGLVAAFDLFAGGLHPSTSSSLVVVLLLALGTGVIACVTNNLPASALLAGLMSSGGLGTYAVMTGLSVGALATPRGSVATIIMRDGAPASATSGYHAIWIPATLLATTAAAVVLWLIG